MYKKRFFKWGFRKNTKKCQDKRNKLPLHAASLTPVAESEDAAQLSYFALTPKGVHATTFGFLGNVKNWSSSFFEAPPMSGESIDTTVGLSGHHAPYFTKLPKEYDAESLSLSFRLIVTLFERGQNVLAGRLARKAFLQTETLLLVEGPVFIWNMLEILHYMATRKQIELCKMLLSYLVDLAKIHYIKRHPVLGLLNSLQQLFLMWRQDSREAHIAILEKGWALNADILFDIFDARFMGLYYRIAWDSSLVNISHQKLRDAESKITHLASKAPKGVIFLESIDTVADLDLRILYNMPSPSSPSLNDKLRSSTIAALRRRSKSALKDHHTKIRLLTGLIKCRTLEEMEPFCHYLCKEAPVVEFDYQMQQTQRKLFYLRTRILAFVIQVLMIIDLKLGGCMNTAIERQKTAIALRQSVQSPTDPQIAYDLSVLETLLLEMGRQTEAEEVRRETNFKLEEYLEDVPENMLCVP